MTRRVVSVYSAAHFCIDFACAFLLFRFVFQAPEQSNGALLYNFCAFAAQMPLGLLADKLNKNALFAVTGCVAVGAAFGLTAFPAAAAVTAGLGNALFHLGGGIDVLNVSRGKAGPLGVFVAPGALGVYFGTLLGKGNGAHVLLPVLALPLIAGLIYILCKNAPKNPPFAIGAPPAYLLIALGLFVVVCARSYVGLSLDFPWKSTGQWGAVLLIATFLGKTAGGFIADRLGPARTGFAALGLSAVFFLFSSLPAAGTGAVFLLNVTMPVTLWGMAKIFPNAKGFAFGVLTFALFVGFLPVVYG